MGQRLAAVTKGKETPTSKSYSLNAGSCNFLENKTENKKVQKETITSFFLVTSSVTSPLTILTTLTINLTR